MNEADRRGRSAGNGDGESLEAARYELLQRIEDGRETPMLILAFVWLALLVVELTLGESRLFETIGTLIWGE